MKKLLLSFLIFISSTGTIIAQSSGACGENLIWEVTNGILTISGTGDMYDYGLSDNNQSPWVYYGFGEFITQIIIGNNVTSIGNYAFYGCSVVTYVDIPSNITRIGELAFSNCSNLLSINVAENNNQYSSLDGALFNKERTKIIQCPRAKQEYTIPNSVTNIGNYAFSGCSGLISIEIPDSVISIGDGAFFNCTGLTSMTFPNSVSSIGDHAFSYCFNLSIVTFSGITNIGNYAFYNDFSGEYLDLTTIYVPCGELQMYKSLLPQYIGIIKYEPQPYALTIGKSTNGYVNVSPHSTICDSVIMKPMPNLGYHFVQWTDGDTTDPRTFVLTQDTMFTAEFSINHYYLSVSCDSVRGETNAVCGDFEHGSEHSFEATPNYGYHFVRWSDGVTDISRTIRLTQDTSIIAEFAKNKYGVSDKSDVNKGYINGTGEYEYLDTLELTAICNRGFFFTYWKNGLVDNPRTIVLTQDTTFEAIFDYLLTDKCGKDSALVWTLDTMNLALNITGAGTLTDIYTYGNFIKSVSISDDISIIGIDAFADCDSLKTMVFGTGLKIIEQGAFPSAASIDTITCYSQRPPTVNNGAFVTLAYSTVVYVPFEYLETYKMHDFWGVYDVRPLTNPEGFEDIDASSAPQKVMIDGQIFILRGEKVYTLQGQEVR